MLLRTLNHCDYIYYIIMTPFSFKSSMNERMNELNEWMKEGRNKKMNESLHEWMNEWINEVQCSRQHLDRARVFIIVFTYLSLLSGGSPKTKGALRQNKSMFHHRTCVIRFQSETKWTDFNVSLYLYIYLSTYLSIQVTIYLSIPLNDWWKNERPRTKESTEERKKRKNLLLTSLWNNKGRASASPIFLPIFVKKRRRKKKKRKQKERVRKRKEKQRARGPSDGFELDLNFELELDLELDLEWEFDLEWELDFHLDLDMRCRWRKKKTSWDQRIVV